MSTQFLQCSPLPEISAHNDKIVLRCDVAGAGGGDGDADGVLAEERVVHETRGEGFFEGAELSLREAWGDDVDAEVGEAQGARGALRSDANHEAFGGQAPHFKVLGDVLADATAQSDEQKLGRRHPVVGGAVLSGLVDDEPVLTRFSYETGAARMVQSDFQSGNLRGTSIESNWAARRPEWRRNRCFAGFRSNFGGESWQSGRISLAQGARNGADAPNATRILETLRVAFCTGDRLGRLNRLAMRWGLRVQSLLISPTFSPYDR